MPEERILNIKEVEEITGISKQNIRYYEKQGLLSPKRNPENDYRIYTEEDIRQLNKIKLFRKLDMSLEDIRQVLSGEVELGEALGKQKEKLRGQKEQLEDVLRFLDTIQERRISELSAESYLTEMENREKKGSVFANFIRDYKEVMKAEEVRSFTFMPDTKCLNRREFTEALCQYANENDLNLIITKEGMFPEFTIDGIEYEAYRADGRWGTWVCCERKNQEDYIPEGMKPGKYHRLRKVSIWLFWLGLILFFIFDFLIVGNFSIADFVH